MNSFFGIGILAAVIYGLLIDGTYFKIYAILIIAYTILTQIGTLSRYNNPRKKCNIATWNGLFSFGPNDPQILVSFEWDLANAEAYLERKRKETGLPLTITHLVGYCAGHAFKNEPDLNGRLCFGNYYPKDKVDLSFLVSCENGKDLGVCKVENADKKSIDQYCQELGMSSKRLRTSKDVDQKKRGFSLAFMPTFLIEAVLHTVGYIACSMGISMGFLGMKKYAFGTCIVTSVGMLGYDHVFAPIPPFTNVPLIITVGATNKKPMVVEDEIKIRDVINVTLTLDHRFTDGARASRIYQKFVKYLHNPDKCAEEEAKELTNEA